MDNRTEDTEPYRTSPNKEDVGMTSGRMMNGWMTATRWSHKPPGIILPGTCATLPQVIRLQRRDLGAPLLAFHAQFLLSACQATSCSPNHAVSALSAVLGQITVEGWTGSNVRSMSCDICCREFHASKRKPLCPSCVQTTLYLPRFEQATTLLDREQQHAQTEAVIRPYNDGLLASLPIDADLEVLGLSSKKHNSQMRILRRTAVDTRTKDIISKAAELRQQIADLKALSAHKRDVLESRKKDLDAEREEKERQRSRLAATLDASGKKTAPRLDRVRNKIADARQLLCREAAHAVSCTRKATWDGKAEYSIGGISIPDLRELNIRTQAAQRTVPTGARTIAEPHDLLSESFENTARLVNLCAHYLQIRLPAEIVLPHADFPRTVIYTERSSYRSSNLSPSEPASQVSSPANSSLLDPSRGRPRPLYIDRPLVDLAKDDPKSFGLFVEGIALLAWNLAWLCKTQGTSSVETFEDFCAIGKNLYSLLHAAPRIRRGGSHRDSGGEQVTAQPQAQPTLGAFSHNSVKNNLLSANGSSMLKDWKLASSNRLTDRLKSYLLNEMSGAEWDVIEEKEWDEEREDEQAVLVGGLARPKESRYVAMSVMSIKPSDGMNEEAAKGNNGWMKVRGRNGL